MSVTRLTSHSLIRGKLPWLRTACASAALLTHTPSGRQACAPTAADVTMAIPSQATSMVRALRAVCIFMTGILRNVLR